MVEQSWTEVRQRPRPEGWVEIPANGWGALVAWAAGPMNTCREPATAGERHTEILTMANGAAVHQPSVLSDANLESLEDDIDAYLAAASVPPLPRGYAWFIRRPRKCRTDVVFWSLLTDEVRGLEPFAEHPLEFRLVLGGVLASLYA